MCYNFKTNSISIDFIPDTSGLGEARVFLVESQVKK